MMIKHRPIVNIQGVPLNPLETPNITYEIDIFNEKFKNKFAGKKYTEEILYEMDYTLYSFIIKLRQRYDWRINPTYNLITKTEELDDIMFAGNVLSEQKEPTDGLKNFVKTLKEHADTVRYDFENLQRNSMTLVYTKDCHLILKDEEITKCTLPRYIAYITHIRLYKSIVDNSLTMVIWYWDWMDEMESFVINSIDEDSYIFEEGIPYEHEDDFIKDTYSSNHERGEKLFAPVKNFIKSQKKE